MVGVASNMDMWLWRLGYQIHSGTDKNIDRNKDNNTADDSITDKNTTDKEYSALEK